MNYLARTVLMLLVIASATGAFADTQQPAEQPWPDNLPLPRFQTLQEKQVPPEPTDDVTPPPTEPIMAVPEFGLQEGVQLAYPFGYNDIFVEIVRECQEVGVVYIVVENTASMSECASLLWANGVPDDNIEYMFHPIDAMWSRDYGPHFVWGEESGEIALVDWQYYDGRPNDDEIPDFMADSWHMNFYETPIYHEGGNYMSDGHGTTMCTTVLYDNNPTWTQAQCEQELMDYYGATTVQVYQKITWDATGHIDLWAKMLNDTTIMVAEMQPDDPNYNLVEQHAAHMAQVPTIYGTPFNVVRCPMPPAYTWWIFHYYKSFINSLIFNGKVLVPIYATEPALTIEALDAYQAAMPDYEVVGIYCDNIAPAGGAIHCTTIGIGEHIADYYHDATVAITPISPPIQIPPGGGSFSYSAQVQNLEPDSIYTEAWVEATLPNGSNYGPIFQKSLELAGGGTVARTLTQYVPGSAPAGDYTFTMYTGSRLPRVVNDSSYFNFTKTGADGDISEGLTGWWTEEASGPAESLAAGVPSEHMLIEAYPNPFNPTTELRFSLPQDGYAELAIYSVNGSKVAGLISGYLDAGTHAATFDASGLSSGVYFARLDFSGGSSTRKLMLLK